MSNEELAVLIKAGDDGFLPQLWEQVRRFIAGKALRFHSKMDHRLGVEVDDLIQAGYFAVLEAVRYYAAERGYKFATYLTRTLKTAFSEVAGVRTSRIDLLLACVSLDEPLGAEDGDFTLLDTIEDMAAADTFQAVEENEYTRQLRAALDDELGILEDTDRRVVELYYYFGLTYQQISEALGCRAPAVKSKARKALQQIKRSRHRNKLTSFIYWHGLKDCHRTTGFATWEKCMDWRMIY